MSRSRSALPWPAVVLAALAVGLLGLPFLGLLWRVPWRRVVEVLGRPAVHDALWLSLRTSLAATVVAIVFGVPLAWLLATVEFPGRGASGGWTASLTG